MKYTKDEMNCAKVLAGDFYFVVSVIYYGSIFFLMHFPRPARDIKAAARVLCNKDLHFLSSFFSNLRSTFFSLLL